MYDSPAYKRLKAEMAHAALDLERAKSLLENAQKEADELRERQDEFRESISVRRLLSLAKHTHLF